MDSVYLNAQCYYATCRGTECHTVYLYAECHYAKWHYAECHQTRCFIQRPSCQWYKTFMCLKSIFEWKTLWTSFWSIPIDEGFWGLPHLTLRSDLACRNSLRRIGNTYAKAFQ